MKLNNSTTKELKHTHTSLIEHEATKRGQQLLWANDPTVNEG